ncbi:MAG: aminotransferase class V-fold PLP-dependent enzyme [Planctomycetaceae bacterium]
MDISRIRTDFPALSAYVWFQNGGVSLTPGPVAVRHAELMEELFRRGPMHIVHPDEEEPRRLASRRRLADFFRTAPEQLALMRGVSEAYQTVLRGLAWQAGDEILISAEEEAALLLPTLHLRDRHQIRIVKLPLLDDPQQQLDAFQNSLSERTRLVALSHVTTDWGFRLPARQICDMARRSNIPTFLDLAHSAGLYPIELDELGCDFAGILSYKWMYAPYAAGLLYIAPHTTHSLQVTYAGGRSERTLDFERDRYELRDSADKHQYGPWSWPLVHAWASACDYLDGCGLDAIWHRTSQLTSQLKQGLLEIPSAHLLTPQPVERSAALVAFSLAGWSGNALATTLRNRWNMIVKPLPHTREGLRISVPFFLLEQEIEQLLTALRSLAR